MDRWVSNGVVKGGKALHASLYNVAGAEGSLYVTILWYCFSCTN